MTKLSGDDRPCLLVVDDDLGIRELLTDYLGEQGFSVDSAEDGKAMDVCLQQRQPDLLILDLMLPGEDGLSLIRRLRSVQPGLPIIMVSARGEDIDRIVGLEVGADDYLAKPFNPRELLARIRSLLRRQSLPEREQTDAVNEAVFRFGPFVFDSLKRTLHHGEVEVVLSRAEFEVLEVFCRQPNRILSREQIMDALGGDDREAFDRSIDVRITRLRKKIETDSSHPLFLRTVWGVGYQFVPTGSSI